MTKEGIIVADRMSMQPSRQYPSLHTSMPIEVFHNGRRRILEVPVYGTAKLDERLCSKYVRLAAFDLFRKQYAMTPAWNRRYKDSLVCEVEDTSLEELAIQGILKPGMIVGIHNPESTHNQDLDLQGNPAKYTHNTLFLGMNRYGGPLFSEQFINAINVRTEENMKKFKLTPIEIIDAKLQKRRKAKRQGGER